MSETGGAQRWLLAGEGELPQRWRERATPVLLLSLLPEEAESVMSGTPPILLDPVDERICRLLADGRTEVEIGELLDLHVRTVQRRVSRLRTRYGLRTTKELAAMLAGKGL